MSSFFLEALTTKNFRNLDASLLTFSPGVNCLFGENGNGKTNLLEAIYFLINRNSFRKKMSFPQLLSMDCGKPQIVISAKLNDGHSHSLSCRIEKDNSEFYLDNQLQKRKKKYPIHYISPSDSFDFFAERNERRRWLEKTASMFDHDLEVMLKKYHRLLVQRNSLLESKTSDYIAQIHALDKIFSKLIFEINLKFGQFIELIRPKVNEFFQLLFGGNQQVNLEIKSSTKNASVLDIYEKLKESLFKDLARSSTTIGTHLNDLNIFLNFQNAIEFCSLGQQKILFLSLNFAAAFFEHQRFQTSPIIMIDDLSGELDQQRWSGLIRLFSHCDSQIFITSANNAFQQRLREIPKVKVFWVSNGHISSDTPTEGISATF